MSIGDYNLAKLGWWSIPASSAAGFIAGLILVGRKVALNQLDSTRGQQLVAALTLAGFGCGVVLAVQSRIQNEVLRGCITMAGLLAVVAVGVVVVIMYMPI